MFCALPFGTFASVPMGNRYTMTIKARIFLGISVVATACTSLLPGADDVLVLANGDRITGQWIETTDEVIVFQSPLLGLLEVDATQATVERESVPGPSERRALSDELNEATTEVGPPRPSEETGKSEAPEVVAEAEAPVEAPKASDVAKTVPPPFGRPVFATWRRFWEKNPVFAFLAEYYPLIAWDNKLELGFDLEMGEKESRNYLFRYSTKEEWERSSLLFEGSYEYSESVSSEGERTTTRDRLRSRLRYRYDFRKLFFVEAETRYRRNLVSKIYHELGQTVGIGYRLFDTEKMKLSFTPSVGVAYQDIDGSEKSFGYLAVFSEDLSYAFSERLKVTQESSLTYQPTEENDSAYIAEFATKLTNMLNQRLSLNLRYEVTYDDRVKDSIAKTNQTVSVSLGAEF
jgi:putative salt-induced outer membrane protein YdiY